MLKKKGQYRKKKNYSMKKLDERWKVMLKGWEKKKITEGSRREVRGSSEYD